MLDTLFVRVAAILFFLVFMAFVGGIFVLSHIRESYVKCRHGVKTKSNHRGALQLDVEWSVIGSYFWLTAAVNITLFAILILFGTTNFEISIPVSIAWALTTGAVTTLITITLDEHWSNRLLGIIMSGMLVCILAGIYFTLQKPVLLGLAFMLITIVTVAVIIRQFIHLGGWYKKIMALGTVAIFFVYFYYGYTQFSIGIPPESRDWETAANIIIEALTMPINRLAETFISMGL